MEGDQDFGRQKISMSRPPLDLTPTDKNTTNGTTSTIKLIPLWNKNAKTQLQTRPMESSTWPTELSTRPTESSKRKGKVYVLSDPKTDSSSSEYNSSDDSNYRKPRRKSGSDLANDSKYRKPKSKKRDKNKKCWKHKKQDSSESSFSDSDSSEDSD